MTNKYATRLCLVGFAAVVLSGISLTAQNKVRIIQTNSAGDNVSVIDPVTNKVMGEIAGIEVNHGAAVAPDGSRIYVSDEAESTLDVVDGKTLKVTERIPLRSRSEAPSLVERVPPG
jgi:YVTN family beta-propeller protein